MLDKRHQRPKNEKPIGAWLRDWDFELSQGCYALLVVYLNDSANRN